jgi:NAD(P)H-hydrate repair Nnr-like enzyme with NAD(P)H-hydrate dehydratase domain
VASRGDLTHAACIAFRNRQLIGRLANESTSNTTDAADLIAAIDELLGESQ